MTLSHLRLRLPWPWRRAAASGRAAGLAAELGAGPARLAAVREYFTYHGLWAPGVRLLRLLSIRDKMLMLSALVMVPALALAWHALAQEMTVAQLATQRLAGLRLVAASSALRVELGSRSAAVETGRVFAGDARQAAQQRLLVAYQQALDAGVAVQPAWERTRVSVEQALAAPAASPEAQARTNALALLALESFREEVITLAQVAVTGNPVLHQQVGLAVNDLPPLQTSLALLRRSLEQLVDSEASNSASTRRAALVDAVFATAVAAERHHAALASLRSVRLERGEEDVGLDAVRHYVNLARRGLLAWSPPVTAPAAAATATTEGADGALRQTPPSAASPAAPGAAAVVSSGLDRAALRSASAAAREQVHTLRQAELARLDTAFETMRDRAVHTRNSLLAGLAVGLVVTLYLMYTFYLVMRGGLNQLNLQISRMASGDLSSRAMPRGVDEVAKALRGMTLSLEHLSDLMASVTQGVGGVKHAAQQVASGNAELSGRNHQTAEGIAAVVDGVARYAVQLEACGRQVEQVVDNVQALRLESARNRKQMKRLRERMVSLRSKSREIGEVVTLMDNIAFRTNILALNASVEASKAGEAGRGFAVVALEVRSLATRGAESAHRIGDIIMRATEDIELSHALVEETGAAMAQADRQVDQIHGAVDGVASLTRAGEKESSELLEQLTAIKRATSDTLNLVEQVANASDAMRSQGERLAYKLGRFKLG